jgi:hypothetical protein
MQSCLSIEEKDLLFCTGIGRWPLPLPSYLCNPANALGISIEEKDLLFCTRIDRWPLPLPSYLCNPANALGLSIEEKDLLFCPRIGMWPSEAAPCPLQPCYFDKWDFFADTWDCQCAMGLPVCIFNNLFPIFPISCHLLMSK